MAQSRLEKLPDITTHFSDWYNEIVYQAELADQAPVRGCIVVRPYGYAIWEIMQATLDAEFKKQGVKNAAFPLLIPLSFLQKEADHVEGFAPEVAVVTHAGGEKLEEPLVVRPTSETVIHYMFARWLHSWRDLPIKVNQWCSVVRWEKRARPFLRTTEFWWQEGHTAHETEQEAHDMAKTMHHVYRDFMQNILAIPVFAERKPPHERFAGATETYTLEGIMPDGKALQMGTSHEISQSFAKAFDMKFQNREGEQAYPYLTSWGVTTRMIGAVVMSHGDNKGLILPPKIAPYQVIIVPIFKTENQNEVIKAAEQLASDLKNVARVAIDADDATTPGAKFYKWELKGVPLRIEIGPRDIANNQVVVVDRLEAKKEIVAMDQLTKMIPQRLEDLQKKLFDRALQRRAEQWIKTDKSLDEIGPELAEGGKFYQVGWGGNIEAVTDLKKYHGTIRCILSTNDCKTCFHTGNPSKYDIIIAKAY
jgi:prolyl-tRNA synthetase